MGNAVLRGNLLRLLALAAHQRDHLHTVNQLEGVEVLDAERACAGESDVEAHDGCSSRMRWPTAVLLAGT